MALTSGTTRRDAALSERLVPEDTGSYSLV
jgi:hypothetical protein